jgi:glyoxylase-like metal-dependent hydrolase (beta-lactamase superfamily II)
MAIRVRVGDAEVIALRDREHRLDRAHHYPGVSEEAWARYADLLDEPGGWAILNFGCFLVRTGDTTVLIDTGWGPEMGPPGASATPARLMDELTEAGVEPDDVDVVAITHLHPDHVGWNLIRHGERVRPRFPRARYLVPAKDWEHYRSLDQVHPNTVQQVFPLEALGVLDLIGDRHHVAPSLLATATPGHTPGHTSFLLTSSGERCFILGDLVHHPVVAEETGWVHRFDWHPERAASVRRRVLEEAERETLLVGIGHFRYPSLGYFVRRDGRRVWKPV